MDRSILFLFYLKKVNVLRRFLTLVLIFVFTPLIAQETIIKPSFLKYAMDSITKVNFNKSLESLFLGISKGEINENLLTLERMQLTKSQLQELVNYETKKDTTTAKILDKQLINLYPISDNEYFISLVYIEESPTSIPKLLYQLNLIATTAQDKFTFSLPIDYLTRYWKTEVIGNVTYHFREKLNKARAALFEKKNTSIAHKLGVAPEKFDFYMCDNYQEILELLGLNYSIRTNGKYRDGYGVDSKTIFSIMNNEDFSHDVFHYYSGQINERKNRNWITEEGIAHAWGNAYYTDEDGEMITLERLIGELKNYLSKNPNTDLFELFSSNLKVFNHLAPELSVRSTISGIIANEVNRKKGKDGILALINAGSRDRMESYLKLTNELIGLNKNNFNTKVGKLIRDN